MKPYTLRSTRTPGQSNSFLQAPDPVGYSPEFMFPGLLTRGYTRLTGPGRDRMAQRLAGAIHRGINPFTQDERPDVSVVYIASGFWPFNPANLRELRSLAMEVPHPKYIIVNYTTITDAWLPALEHFWEAAEGIMLVHEDAGDPLCKAMLDADVLVAREDGSLNVRRLKGESMEYILK